MSSEYKWKFIKLGGETRVSIETGEDIVHLPELDQKMWTVLSCPVKDLEFSEATLSLLDADGDGRVRVQEVNAAAGWLRSVLKDYSCLTGKQDELPLSIINEESEEGARLLHSAKKILSSLGKADSSSISVADTSDIMAIFASTVFNGDGVIIDASTEDAELKKTIAAIASCMGSVKDRSGADGIAQEQIDAFYAALKGYSAWLAAAEADKATIFPYGDDTAAALAACEAVKTKLADFFMRCKLVAMNADAGASLDFSADRIVALSTSDLSSCDDKIAELPVARVNAEGKLPLAGGINPAWAAAFKAVKTLVLDKDFAGKEFITEEDWNGVCAKLAPYAAWAAAKTGAEVESLGAETVSEMLKADRKADLDALVLEDKALETEFNDIQLVGKLLLLNRDFYTFVRNFVTFADFYQPKSNAVFQCGKLFIDQRCCDLCIKVTDTDSKGSIAALSGMYVVYCDCVCKKGGAKMTVAAVVTDGDVDNIRVGKNCLFYDMKGNDWDAVVTKIIDNPISIRQAFLSPYKKIGRFITDKISGMAAKQESKVMDQTLTKIDTASTTVAQDATKGAEAAKGKGGFDIATFAGIFAAIGMAIGYIGKFLSDLAKGVADAGFLKTLLVICAIVLVISLPSMFLAWLKLRKRNIAPVLNVNGWAMNSKALVNTAFGATLTSVVHFPMALGKDPFEPKKKGRGWVIAILILLVIAAGVWAALHFMGCCCCA